MMRDPLPLEPQEHRVPRGAGLRVRLIPALNPCWRLWLREEGPLELMCLAQIGLELWSVQTDGVEFYFCHDRNVRKLLPGCTQALRRDIHSVRGGFVREVRLHLGEQAASNAVFGRDRPSRFEAEASAALPGSACAEHAGGLSALRTADHATGDRTEAANAREGAIGAPLPRGTSVQVSYRRRRQVDPLMAARAHA